MRIDNDINAIRAYLDQIKSIPSGPAIIAARQYQAAWKRRGYTPDQSAKALEWYWRNRAPSTESRPKTVDEAVGEYVLRNANAQYKFNVNTPQPCLSCQYLSPGNEFRGEFCDRLLIWVADPKTSTCPEHIALAIKATP